MTNEREAFEDWFLRDYGRPLCEIPDHMWQSWQASRKVACDQVVAHFEGYTNPVAGHILAEQVKEILK